MAALVSRLPTFSPPISSPRVRATTDVSTTVGVYRLIQCMKSMGASAILCLRGVQGVRVVGSVSPPAARAPVRDQFHHLQALPPVQKQSMQSRNTLRGFGHARGCFHTHMCLPCGTVVARSAGCRTRCLVEEGSTDLLSASPLLALPLASPHHDPD